MTITIDDAGNGDLLFGVVIGAFRDETQEFRYGVIYVKYFKSSQFYRKEYLKQSSRIVSQLLSRLKPKSEEEIHICKGYIFDEAVNDLRRTYGDNRIRRVKVNGEPQRLTEIAYLDEIRNLGYEPLKEREDKRAKEFLSHDALAEEKSGQTEIRQDWLATPVEIPSIQILSSK